MGKLIFTHGPMGSSKTAMALMERFNYISNGRKVLLAKPKIDTRDGSNKITSRIGLSAECINIDDITENKVEDIDIIIIDEGQFLNPNQVSFLAYLVDKYDIIIHVYGLKTNFMGKLFKGSESLICYADEVNEETCICWCGNKALFNARIINDEMVRTGEEVMIGSNDLYVPLCRKHFLERKWKPNNQLKE